jgi:excisionase family DNA binding protein
MQVEAIGLYRVRAVAAMLDVHPATIYRAVESGALRAVRMGAGKGAVRIPRDALSAYLAACQTTTAPTTHLSDAQADGLACVICGANFLVDKVTRYPVGRSDAGSQVFACVTHRDDPTGEVESVCEAA